MAFTFAQFVAFTPSILERLDDEELTAVAVHELAHLTESRAQKLTRLSGLLIIFPFFAMPVFVRQFEVWGFVVPLTIFLTGSRFLRAFAQKLERRADAAAHTEPAQGAALASALEKLYEFNVIPAVMPGKRQIHPHLYDRMLAAGLQPSYPRPAPPGRWMALVGAIVTVAISLSPLTLADEATAPWIKKEVHPRRPYGRY